MGSSSSSNSSKSSSSSNAGKKGGDWKGKVYFDPNSDSKKGEDYHIDDAKLEEKMKSIIDDSELIEKIWVYKNPLSPWQLTQLVFHHRFVVLETSDWWWSIEKNTEGITIQRSKHITYVRDNYRRNKRLTPVAEMNSDKGRMKMKDLVEFLYKKDELNKTYNVLSENCQDFSKRIFDEFAKSKYL